MSLLEALEGMLKVAVAQADEPPPRVTFRSGVGWVDVKAACVKTLTWYVFRSADAAKLWCRVDASTKRDGRTHLFVGDMAQRTWEAVFYNSCLASGDDFAAAELQSVCVDLVARVHRDLQMDDLDDNTTLDDLEHS